MTFFQPRIMQWSYSRLKTWEECPLKAKFKFVLKLKEPDSPYASRGLEIHKQLASFLVAPESPLPDTLHNLNEIMHNLRTPNVKAELQVAFDKDWNRVEWFGPTVYVRIVYDILEVSSPRAYVADLKTGKMRPEEHQDQLSLYAVGVMAEYRDIAEAETAVLYADHPTQPKKNPLTKIYKREEFKDLRSNWEERAAKMLNDDIFAPRPGPYCRWCAYSKERGGACPVN